MTGDALRHKPFGLTHPTWDQPMNFYYETEDEAWAAISRTYGPGSGHLVVGVLTRPEGEAAVIEDAPCPRCGLPPTAHLPRVCLSDRGQS